MTRPLLALALALAGSLSPLLAQGAPPPGGAGRIALATYTVHGPISSRGRRYQLVVQAYRVRDGARLDPREHEQLAQPESWSEGCPRRR